MNRRIAALRRHAVVATAILALALPGLAGAACQLASIDMPVSLVAGRAVAQLGIGDAQVPLAVDSGAFFSMLTEAAAQQLHLETTMMPTGMRVYGLAGTVDARLATVKSLKFVNGQVPKVHFIVGMNEPGAGTMGLLGRDLLMVSDIEFDLAHGMIRLMLPNADCDGKSMAYWAKDTPVTALNLIHDGRSATPPIEAWVTVNGRRTRALFDTGATTTLSLLSARAAGIAEADMTPTADMYGVGEGRRRSWTANVASLDIGGEVIANSRMDVGDFDMQDMLLGIDFFLSHRIYVSKRQHRMFLTYNGGPVFALNKVGEAPQATTASAASGEVAPTTAEGYARRGAARAARHDDAGALADLDRACEMAPGVAINFARRGEAHLRLGQVPQAFADLDTALRLDPTQAEARSVRADLYAANHRNPEARADLDVLDHELPPGSDLRREVGQLYEELGLFAQALPEWSQWLATHPHEVGRDRVLNARCWTRVRQGAELDQALADCDAAVALDAGNAAFVDSRGWVHVRRAEWRAALSDFDQAIRLKPDEAFSLYGRGLVHAHEGQAEAARADFAAARTLDAAIDAKVRHAGVAGDLVLLAR